MVSTEWRHTATNITQILPPPPEDIDETDVIPEPDNPNDSDYAPPEDIDDTDVTSGPNNLDYKPPRKHYAPTRRNGLEETMDEDELKIYIHGITPEMAAERRQKK